MPRFKLLHLDDRFIDLEGQEWAYCGTWGPDGNNPSSIFARVYKWGVSDEDCLFTQEEIAKELTPKGGSI